MIFHGKNRTIPPNIKRIYLNGVEVKRVDTFKYIGLILDSKLTFAPHINSVCNKLNKFFGIFSHIKNKIPQHMKRQVYYSTIFPHINYGLEIIGSCSSKLINKIQRKQNQLMKVLTNRDMMFPTNELHLSNNILKIDDIYKVKILTFVHDCLNKKVIPLFQNYFQYQRDTHNYHTRNPYKLVQTKAKTNLCLSSVKSMGATLWNNSAIAQSNINSSKHLLKSKLMKCYVNSYQLTN